MNDPDLIIRIAARGDGVTADGRYAAYAAPGDFLRADGAVEHGPDHADPSCSHFPSCGGCQLQHLSSRAYAAYVTDRIIGALEGQDISAPHIMPPQISPPRSRRRVNLRAERRGKQIILGFAKAGSHHIINMRECPVMHPTLWAIIAPLRLFLLQIMKDKKSAGIMMSCCDQGVDLMIGGVDVQGLTATQAIADFAAQNELARLSIDQGDGPLAWWEPQSVSVTLGGVAVPYPVGSFLQATASGEASLVIAAQNIMTGATNIADLFAGLGTFTFAMNAPVHAVEGARDPILALQNAANRTGRKVSSEHRDLYRRPLTPVELARYDGVILDPPRAGAQEQIAALCASTVARIAYVSCNPATFARDSKALIAGGYKLEHIHPVGQFSWSIHVELIAMFYR
jgi:23S rRNA (uracil1939-C5)-methyltransferase